MMKHSVDHATCKSCNLCIEVCPGKILDKNDSRQTIFIESRLELCVRCGQCMAVCETRSISIEGLNYENQIIPNSKHSVDYQTFYDFMATRRSIRNFKKEQVPDDLIKKILEIVEMAPYGANSNSSHITIINNRKLLEEALPIMSGFYDKLGKWMKNPFMRYMIRRNAGEEEYSTITGLLLDKIFSGHYKLDMKQDHITRNAPALMLFHAPVNSPEHTFDSMIWVVYANLAMHSLGLGGTINGLVPPAINKSKELKVLFGIPQSHEVVISIIFGFPRIKYHWGIKRDKNNVRIISEKNN